MGYAWREESEREGNLAARIPAGDDISVRISKVVFGDRQGAFSSRAGDPQILIVFQDHEAREAGMFVTLNERAAFVLAKVLAACDPAVNLARMEADGIEPRHFADESFANRVLLNRSLRINLQYEAGKDGKEYPHVVPVRRRDAAASGSPAEAPPTADDPPPTVDAPPASDDPPPTEGAAPKPRTKEDAWARVLTAWQGNTDPQAKQRRNDAWMAAIREQGKPDTEFTPDDWAKVVAIAEVPF